jgi:hypothetical protein
MSRFKPAGTHRGAKAPRSNKGLIPCGILILAAFALLFLLLYEVLKSSK